MTKSPVATDRLVFICNFCSMWGMSQSVLPMLRRPVKNEDMSTMGALFTSAWVSTGFGWSSGSSLRDWIIVTSR